MIPFVPEYIRSLVPYSPGKPIEETQRELGISSIVKLASNENPLGPSPQALKAAQKYLREGHRYPDAGAYLLKKALVAHLRVRNEELITGNGSNEIIDLLIRTFCSRGDSIVTSKAAFIAYRICAQVHGVKTLESPLTSDFRFDLESILELLKRYEKARMVFIPNPNNPTGTYVNERELRWFLKACAKIKKRKVLVVLDSAYQEYVTAKDLPDPMRLYREFENVVVLRTFSKVYGLAGFRVGYGIARPEITGMMQRIRQPFNLNGLGQVAATAALEDRAFVKKSVRLNQVGLKFWERELDRLGIFFWPSQGNFILADVGRSLGKRGEDVYLACLRKGVIFRPVANYGLTNALRVSIGTSLENRKALKALEEELPLSERNRRDLNQSKKKRK